MSVTMFVGEVGERNELISGEAAAQHAGAHRRQAGLLLRGDADVVAIDVVGDDVFAERRWIQFVTEFVLDGRQHRFGGPAVLHEEVFNAGVGAAFAQHDLLAEDLYDGGYNFESLRLRDEGGNAHSEVRFVRQTAADAQCVTDFVSALDGGEGDVVDLRVGAPQRAAGDGDFEFARQVVELGVGGE